MTKLFNLILLIPIISAQLISISLCSDRSCKKDCTKLTTNSGQCYPCESIYCITTLSSITFYSDSSCFNILEGSKPIPLIVDNTCKLAILEGTVIGSYQALNLSMLIGLTVGFSLLVLGVIIASICYCKKNNTCCYKKFGIKLPPIPEKTSDSFTKKNPEYPQSYSSTVMTYNNPVINY